MFANYIDNLLGTVPSGYEALRYAVSAGILIFVIALAYRMIQYLFGIR